MAATGVVHPPLPVPLTTLVGREDDLASLRDLLGNSALRLLTLTGAGGSGKTRLAQQLALDLQHDFADGAWFISLATITKPELVIQTIALEFGIREGADLPLTEQLIRRLRERHLLLVLDNFEQVGDAAPDVAHLLRECPRLTIVVTSRVPLHIQGEQEYPVPPLALPGAYRSRPAEELASFSSVALFVDRARAVDPAFMLDETNARSIADICLRLDGLPLAIELAAARMKVISPEELLARLAHSLRVLIGGSRDQPARQRTLRDTIAWSYDLLSADEQQLFRRLSVCAGGFTLDAAEALAGEVDALDGVTSLVDKSLLRRSMRGDSPQRFEMLATIREYALEQLSSSGEEDATRHAHLQWCLKLAECASAEMVGHEQAWLGLLEAEHDNLRAGLTWAADLGDGEALCRLTASLWTFWSLRGYMREGLHWLKRAAAAGDGLSSPARAQSLAAAGAFAAITGDLDTGVRWIEEGLQIARATGDLLSIGMALYLQGDILIRGDIADDTDLALTSYRQSADVFRAAGNPYWQSIALAFGASTAVTFHRFEHATSMLDEAMALARDLNFEWVTAFCTTTLGRIATDRHKASEALQYAQNSLRTLWEIGDPLRIVRSLERLAAIAATDGQAKLAAQLMGCAEMHAEVYGLIRMADATREFDEVLALLNPQMSPAALTSAWSSGRAMTLEAGVQAALAISVSEDRSLPSSLSSSDGSPRLSARELEVLQLLVAGQTDRQIAESLFISHRTAQYHVANIFNKLGVNSRTAAATSALREGLVSAQ